MKYFLFLLHVLFSSQALRAQNQYTQNNFTVVLSNPNLVYGIETNFAGILDTLRLDIYKPVGDQNCQRPLLVLVHGGSWIAGSKYDSNILLLAQEMAKKGYVVAAINYRLGMHKTSNYSMYWACNNGISAPCAYVSDSSEVIRALYRGMQDTKGAIRFMKERASVDSIDINNVYLAGESAGGFNVLAATFMQEEFQKPADCFAISDAGIPDPDLLSCLPSVYSLSRPDLGSVEGNLHIGSMNSKVKGVANFYGGLFDLSLINSAAIKPALYLFHQGSDVVVDYLYNKVLGRINWECFAPTNVCQPYPYTPYAHGSESIRRQLDSMGTQAPLHHADIVYNFNYMNDCFANGHSIDNVVLRSLNMAELFSIVIDSSGNIPPMNCSLISVPELSAADFSVYPNPAGRQFNILYSSTIRIKRVVLRDLLGKELETYFTKSNFFQIILPENVLAGLYFLEIECDEGIVMKKILVQDR